MTIRKRATSNNFLFFYLHKEKEQLLSKIDVDIIIPTFNCANYIKNAINSVLNQSFANIKVTIIDDGSVDETKKIVTSYSDLVTYIYQDNKGPASARNRGIKTSKSKYIAFLDSDDYFLANNLQRKISLLEKNPDIPWVYSDWQYVDDQGNYLEKGSERFNFSTKKLSGEIFEELLYKRNFIATDSVVMRRSLLDDVGLFDEIIPSQEEYDLWLRISAKYPVLYINDVLLTVTIHPQSLSKDFGKWACGNAFIVNKIENIIPEKFHLKKKDLARLHADKQTFLARAYLEKGLFREAFYCYINSIKKFPFQKRVYLSLFLLPAQMLAKSCIYWNHAKK